MLKTMRNTTFVIWMIMCIASVAFSTSVWAIIQTQKVAALSKAAAIQLAQNRKQIARFRAKARLKRIAVSIPIAGLAAAAYFEDQDRREWLEDNPGKDSGDYACEIAELTVEVMDEVLSEMPMGLEIPSWAVPECEVALVAGQ